MTREEKQLLFKDLCGRLPYGVMIQRDNCFGGKVTEKLNAHGLANDETYGTFESLNFKPYLRSMSSMTEEECITLSKLIPYETDAWKHIKTPIPLYIANIEQFDFFHRHHLDWRGLIQKGLALEAPTNMYKIE